MGRKIKLERDLYGKLERVARSEGYSSTGEFIRHILEQRVAGTDDVDESRQVKEQLKGLGYLS